MKVVGSRKTTSAIESNLKTRIEGVVDVVLEETLRKSRCTTLANLAPLLGRGSYEHTNFRMFLAPHVVELLDGDNGVGKISRAWVHSIDVTESDPSAADTAGDGSPCDGATGQRPPIILQVDEKNPAQKDKVRELNDALV